ncbi:MAG: hypothetical protein L6V91_01315 [Bacilli bacterium]|nr:MAG: hypothetical protein L6V91_01315 [Bacilli bacterium]
MLPLLHQFYILIKFRQELGIKYFSILSTCHTNELNLDVEVPGVGYTRTFRKCFDIDSQGQFVERILVTDYIKQFVDNNTKME